MAVHIAGLGLLLAAIIVAPAARASHSADARLTLKLRALSEKVCFGSVLPLEMTLTNESASDIKLSRLEIWSNFGVESLDAKGQKRGAGLLIVPGTKEAYERMQNEIITLNPGSPYLTTYQFGVSDARVFIPESYQINSLVIYHAGHDRSASNSVTVEVVHCNTN